MNAQTKAVAVVSQDDRHALVSHALRSYDLARTYLAECASVDQIAEVEDAAARMAAYARVIGDKELEGWVAEIRCRAVIRLGQESKRLPTKPAGRPKMLPSGGKNSFGEIVSKEEVLRTAGISTSAASRYEQLASAEGENPTAAEAYYEQCRNERQPPTLTGMAQAMKKDHRNARERDLAERIGDEALRLGMQRYGVILADPPWQFEPRSRETGMDRAADNHYPTMGIDQIKALDVPASDDCVLFLWATSPMLPEALETMMTWGFDYKSSFIWIKDRAGTGYWNRNRHELLLVGTKGNVPAPAPGTQFDSVFEAGLTGHSRKPTRAVEMIEAMFPNVPKLEMFARAARRSWDSWGAEAEVPVSER